MSTSRRPSLSVPARVLVGLASAAALVAPAVAAAPALAKPPVAEVGTWSTAPDVTPAVLDGQSIRNIIHTSVGGTDLRISLSNAFGDRPVTFDAVRVGRVLSGAAVEPGSNQRLTFGGATTVTIPVGGEVLSDPLPGTVAAEEDLAVSLHVVGNPGVVTGHKLAWQTSYVSGSGDHTADESGTAYENAVGSWYFVESAVVTVPKQQATVVAFGDSITDGDKSTPGANLRYPDQLARRLLAQPKPHQVGVMNQGISGNRVLADGPGVAAVTRFERDALSQPDVETVILLQGVNDLRWEFATKPEDLTNAYQQLIDRAHTKGVCVVGGTILPWEGGSLWSAPKDAIREQVNTWIRTSGAFDAVVDFDDVMRDPQRPARMLPAYDSGDHLHPGDAGYAAMASAVNLKDLTCRR